MALDLELGEDLLREGLAREVVHAVQSARKSAGLAVEDRIELSLSGDEELLGAVRAHELYVTVETLATALHYDGATPAQAMSIDGRAIGIGVARSDA